jgi:hypothetical protein
LSEARKKKELWERRWKAGEESICDIAQALKKPPGSIHGVLKEPPRRDRSTAQTLARMGARPARAGGDLPGSCGRGVDARYSCPLRPVCLDSKPGGAP